jgi:hypothetical protein
VRVSVWRIWVRDGGGECMKIGGLEHQADLVVCFHDGYVYYVVDQNVDTG